MPLASILPTLKFIARHPLSKQRLLCAYWRYARWQTESRLRNEVVFDWIEGSKLIVRNGMTGATGNIYCGLHEFADMAFLLHLLRPGELFVDVGANIGSYTTLASAVCGARSFAIEPDPETVRSLKKNVEVNGISELVTVIESAVGATSGTLQFTMGQDTTNRVAVATDAATREVQVSSLDEIIGEAHPVLIKLDVEGYEPLAFAGATNTLKKRSLIAVITETADHTIRSLMSERGFTCASYEPLGRVLALNPVSQSRNGSSNNTLFVRADQIGDRLFTATRRRAVGVDF